MPKAIQAMTEYQQYFTLVAENEYFVVINKKAGINFHTEEGDIGVVVAAERALKQKLYSVHRLDKMTSGLLLLAKSSQDANGLSELFKTQQIQKYYLAISDKKPKKTQGLIKGGMEKSRRSMWKLTRKQDNIAITQFFSYALGDGKRLFVVKPKTGKTHQIRVALKSIGSAICGDLIYATEDAYRYDRGYLHAYQIQFDYAQQSFNFIVTPEAGKEFLLASCQDKLLLLDRCDQLNWPKI
ncbi:TIGR01621 family pseudouridine synthase [Psychromonas sp. RZ22]|uniref:TIGR01621 family pseudouridine synthase n=1 Tax=Psychromonas algarum TaxID=2555643 RepID=UPI0010680E6B|nr:TIGR01621 family pseudouridine synthase [Psychromonas sp. RZ22]TEW55993.1 TIGR01621 family pseudouridine synthase [Psychromonas sp. RZ22]